MRRTSIKAASAGLALILMTAFMPSATAATTLPCSKGTGVKTVKGKSTMVYKGKRVPCALPKVAPKPKPTATVAFQNNVRIAGGTMNDVYIKPNLTITIRNTTSTAYTLVVAGTDISVNTPGNDISAFISPSKPGVYQMSIVENPNIKATLTVVQ